MSTSSILRYIYILTFSILLLGCPYQLLAQSNTDTTAVDTTEAEVKSPEVTSHQLAFSFDATQPFINSYSSVREGYEFAIDYYLHKELYLVLEGGWGSAHVNYTDLAYNSKNSYYALGINKCLISRLTPNDWDMAFMGVRLAAAPIERTTGTYTVVDSFWGSSSGTIAAKNFVGVWAEITAGIRLELIKGFCVGWNIRGKFMLDGKSFKDLPPTYIAGYGKGDKGSVFDFNLYLTYAIRWRRQHPLSK